MSYKIKKFNLDFGTNSYLLIKNNNVIIIDAPQGIEEIIKYININSYKPKYLLLTHGHFDHILGANLLKETFPKIKTFASKEDIPWLLGEKNNIFIKANFKPDAWLKDGDVIIFSGENIKVIKTPGHSKGSLSFLITSDLFTGDVLFKGSVGRTDFFGGSRKKLDLSLKKLAKLPLNTKVYPGHGETSTILYERKNNIFLRRLLNENI